MANLEQAEYWDGAGGEHWVVDAERYDEINRRFGERIVSAVAAQPRRRAAALGLDNVSFDQGDAQVAPLAEATFDAAVSRFGVMFFGDPVAAFANIGRALRPGGRLVFACWQDLLRNEWELLGTWFHWLLLPLNCRLPFELALAEL